MSKRIVFYDTECSFCHKWAMRIAKWDKKEVFYFASIKGSHAQKMLSFTPKSILFLEASKVYIKSKAIFRILWLLGGSKKIIGLLFFLPGFLFDWLYNVIARLRSHKFQNRQLPPRFLK